MRLGIDLDGVVADFNAGWIERYNREFDTDVPVDSVQTWGGLHELTHFTDMEAFWDWARGSGDGSVFRHLEVYEHAVETLEALRSAGHAVVIITTKPDWAVHDTLAWLADHRIPTREIHITWRKWLVPCDVYLDDAPHQLARIHRHRPEAATCRFVRPWNRPMAGVHDVPDWQAFASLVRSLDTEMAE